MTRKEFISKTSLASAGILLLNTSCQKENIFEGVEFNGKVLIIGAGAAGLYAGYLLKQNGINFEIIEASDRIGGRMGKIEGFSDFPLDSGAQWLHGKKSILGDIINKNKVRITEDDSEVSFWFKNELVESLPKNILNEFEGQNLPDLSFEQHAKDQGYSDDYKYMVEWAAGDLGADASNISVFWTNEEFKEWSSGEKDYKFQNTFFDVIKEHIASEVSDKIVLNSPISQISFEEEKVQITDRNGNNYKGDYAIITVPISILKEGSIEFKPTLPNEKINAFQKIGMGAGMKVFLKFKEKFYPQNVFGGSICASYADESVGKIGSDHVLLAFVMGEQAEYLSSLINDDAIVNLLLQELDEMFDEQASKTFENAYVQDWYKMPYIKGAYSYSTVNMGEARKLAAQPVANKLFFAGEAMNTNGHHQTVHGAMESGEQAVKNIGQLLK